MIETYRSHFPQLWEQRDLIIRLDPKHSSHRTSEINDTSLDPSSNTLRIAPEHSESYVLRLFIKSDNFRGEKTLSSIHQLLEQGLASPYTLKVIDISKNPEQAAIDCVTVTPTLIRVAPKPVRRIIGQFDDIQRVLKIISSF
nr:circadian clock KaiB family protein [Pleurocapsa sp. FMAR1]